MLSKKIVKVHLKQTFRISHGATDEKEIMIANIDGGIGEASPVNYYGESIGTIGEFIDKAAAVMGDDPFKLEDILNRLEHLAAYNFSAKAAIDIALHDLVGKRLGIPVYKLLGITPRDNIATSYTISINDPDSVKKQIQANPGYKVYKVKVGVPNDIDMVAAVRESTNAAIRVDANGGWSLKEAVQKIKLLQKYDVEFVEQPLHWKDFEGFKILRRKSDLPIFADEGIMRAEDIAQYYGLVDGINIKLMKSGGIREAFKMISIARALQMKIMIGCMVETSAGISAAAQIAPLVDYVDLDGNLLIADDPFDGIRAVDGYLKYNDKPGIGVTEKK